MAARSKGTSSLFLKKFSVSSSETVPGFDLSRTGLDIRPLRRGSMPPAL